jgi:hypothetical protein
VDFLGEDFAVTAGDFHAEGGSDVALGEAGFDGGLGRRNGKRCKKSGGDEKEEGKTHVWGK